MMFIFALCWITLSGGVILRSKVQIGEKEMVNVWYAQEGNFRWDSGKEYSIIYTGGDNMLKILDGTAKEYFAVNLDKFEKQIKAMQAKMESLKAKMPKIKSGPFGKFGKKVKKEVKEETKIVKKGTEQVAGFPCDKYEVSIGSRKIGTFWTTDPANLGFDLSHFKLLRKIKNLYSAFTRQATQGMEKIENYPIKNIIYDKAGKPILSQELIDVKKGPIDPATFQVPKDFKQKEEPPDPLGLGK